MLELYRHDKPFIHCIISVFMVWYIFIKYKRIGFIKLYLWSYLVSICFVPRQSHPSIINTVKSRLEALPECKSL